MELRRLSNSDLHMSFKCSIQAEREALKDVLLHVIEIDRRQLYFDYDCSSLFGYLTSVMGYSNGPAQRRIDAARLSYEIPQLVETIQAGELNLDQVRLVQQSVRQVAKESNQRVSTSQKIEVFNQIAGKTVAESEVIVAKALDVKIKQAVRIQRQADGSVAVQICFSPEQWGKQEEMRTLLSHSLPTGSWDEVYDYVADKVILQKSKLAEKRKYTKLEHNKHEGGRLEYNKPDCSKSAYAKADDDKFPNASCTTQSNFMRVEPNKSATRKIARKHIPLETQRQVHRRDMVCQYKNKVTGNKCASKWKLQADHIVSVWAGGDNSFDNLHLLCAAHNQAKYRNEAGIRRL